MANVVAGEKVIYQGVEWLVSSTFPTNTEGQRANLTRERETEVNGKTVKVTERCSVQCDELELSEHARPLGVADFRVRNEGTVVVFTPVSEAARVFVEENLDVQGWQSLGGGAFAVDHRPAEGLVRGLIDEGFAIVEVA